MNSRRIWESVWVSVLLFWSLAVPARATTPPFFAVESFYSDVTIKADASIVVTETIRAQLVAKHGIFRNIPFEYATDQGDTIRVPIDIQQVRRNGQAEPFTTSVIGREVQVKIGEADVFVNGGQEYQIIYSAQAAVNFFDDHDELYWNVTGENWEVSLGAVEASIRLDGQVPEDQLQVRCFTGTFGSTGQDCIATTADSTATFSAENEFLTVVFGWPKGIVTKPDNYDALRSTAGKTALEQVAANAVVFWGLNVVFPLLVIVWLSRRWLTHGRDPKKRTTEMAQYDPPAGLTPGEMGTLFDERANHRDIVATIVDMAVRGFLTITQVEEKKLLGLRTTKDYRLDRQSKADATKLKPHERKLMDGLFADGDSVKLSDLKGSFADDVRAIQSDLYRQLADGGFFVSNPQRTRSAYVAVGLVVAGLGLFLIGLGIVGVSIAGAAIALFGPFMPKRTTRGVEAFWHAQGFKLFLERAEKHRIQWQERGHVFEQFLPYAMTFGVAEKWSQVFEGVRQAPPSWYRGASGSRFNSLVLWSALNDFSTSATRSFAPPAASGGSGFGGGGFSGGGFGGGGGGSW